MVMASKKNENLYMSGNLTLCMQGNFSCFCWRLLTLKKKKNSRNTISVKQFGTKSGFGLDLGLNCLQKVQQKIKIAVSKEIVNPFPFTTFVVCLCSHRIFKMTANVKMIRPLKANSVFL